MPPSAPLRPPSAPNSTDAAVDSPSQLWAPRLASALSMAAEWEVVAWKLEVALVGLRVAVEVGGGSVVLSGPRWTTTIGSSPESSAAVAPPSSAGSSVTVTTGSASARLSMRSATL